MAYRLQKAEEKVTQMAYTTYHHLVQTRSNHLGLIESKLEGNPLRVELKQEGSFCWSFPSNIY